MSFKSLQHYISKLEEANELIRIKNFVDPELEITEITDRFSKLPDGGKALLFENTGTGFPVLTNALGSLKRIGIAFGVSDIEELSTEIHSLLSLASSPKKSILDKLKLLPVFNKVSSWMPRSISGKGECQEVIIKDPDLSILPILKCWPADGGRFVTLPLVHTIDPVTGTRNLGMYRMQVFDKNLTGMHWHRHKTGARHYMEYHKLGQKMPVAVALGGDPAYTYSATAPLPDQIDEYILAGFLRKKRVELVKCITQDIEVPRDADIIIEGYVDPQEELIWEGPFGDHTGFYSLEDWYPKFHITCITHRRNAIYPATIVGIPPQEDAWIARATERIFFQPLKFAFCPELTDIDLPPAGVAHNLAILKIEKHYPGQGQKVINALWGAGQMMFNKVMVITDENIDIHDYKALFRQVITSVRIPQDLMFTKGPLDVLDHSSDRFAFGGKLGIDATRKLPEEIDQVDKISVPIKPADVSAIKSQIPEINEIIFNELPFALFSLKKEMAKELPAVFKKLSQTEELAGIKLFICFDSPVNLNNEEVCAWQAFSNIDPIRDCIVTPRKAPYEACLCINATAKASSHQNFPRPWPNVVTSSPETIEKVDSRWPDYFNEPFIHSPSLNYHPLSRGTGAVADIN
ncbi:MAG: menaquinone biosynthesis decarboxylase [Bacteroidota bacterium]|nr:menaquinone biosynthesis decarboxylase [Bacteroidota bacterium]